MSAPGMESMKPLLDRKLYFLSLDKYAKKDDIPSVGTLIVAIATAIGAWGGFPSPPRGFDKLVNNEIAQYGLVWILLWQGGGSQNWKICSLITGAMYALHKVLDA